MASLTPPMLAPIYLPGQEPMPAGTTPQEREEYRQVMKWQGWMNGAMDFCPLKTVLSGGAGMSISIILTHSLKTFTDDIIGQV